MRTVLKRLWTLAVIFIMIVHGTAFASRQIPNKTLLRWHGVTGEVLYQYPLAEIRQAYILHDEETGTVSFAVVNGERLVNHQLFPYFKDIEYASEIRPSDLQLLRQLYIAVNETSTDRIYSTAQHMFWMNHGNFEVKYITRGITLEPERLEGQTVLFQTEIDGATVFCIESKEPRAIVTKEDIRQDVS